MDLGSPELVVAALYDLISGPGGDRDWAAVRDLFLPDAVLQSELLLPDGARQSGRWTVDAFIGEASADYARLGGFWEREVWSRVDRYGDIAQVWSTYESRVGTPGAPPAVRGINAIQLCAATTAGGLLGCCSRSSARRSLPFRVTIWAPGRCAAQSNVGCT